MPNMLDYIAWRGDLTPVQSGINENDLLLLSQFAYVAFGDYIPGPDKAGASVALADAVAWLLDHDPDAEKIHQTGFMWKNNLSLLEALHGCPRYAAMRLFGYVDTVSEADEKQFAAVTIDLGDGSALIAYRGTDDSLIGWKEDLNMAYETPVPAQLEATAYLERMAGVTPSVLRLSGHSKGGNLAVYAAATCSGPVEARLRSIHSFDGPGHSAQTIQSPGYARIRDRLRVFIPHFSIVGMLLEHESDYAVVQSDAKTFLQHDAFSWQMLGTGMVYADAPSKASLHTNQVIRQWIDTLDAEQRRLFIDAVFEIACATYGDTIPEDVVETRWPTEAQAAFTAIFNLEPSLRGTFTKTIGELFSTALKSIRLPWHRDAGEENAPELEKP